MKNFLIVQNKSNTECDRYAKEIEDIVTKAGGKVSVLSRAYETMREPISLDEGIECVIVLGGDGSILRTVRGLYPGLVPMVGINLGHLGFLTQTEIEGMDKMIDKLLKDEYKVENRMMLSGTMTIIDENAETQDTAETQGELVTQKNAEVQGKTVSKKDIALNDIVIARSGISRLVRLKVLVNGELLDTYDGDGVVISTPTGSTAYNLSAGGPVVYPMTNLMVITPISPHRLSSRSVVISANDKVSVVVMKARSTDEDALVTFDGQTATKLHPGDRIDIEKLDKDAKLIKVREESFFDVLRSKIR